MGEGAKGIAGTNATSNRLGPLQIRRGQRFVHTRHISREIFQSRAVEGERLVSGRPSSIRASSHPPLALFDPDLIPLEHLVEGGVNVGATGSAFEDSQVDLGEVAVGTLSEVYSNMLHHFLHIHRAALPVGKRSRRVHGRPSFLGEAMRVGQAPASGNTNAYD